MSTTWRRLDWGHVTLVAIFAGITVFYLVDAWQASSRVKNLILILPASLLTLVLCGIVLAGIVRQARARHPDDGADEPGGLRRQARLIGLFAAYILSLPWLGFDVGTALFMAASLLMDGERRPLVALGVPMVFAAAVTALFAWLLPYPLPTLLL